MSPHVLIPQASAFVTLAPGAARRSAVAGLQLASHALALLARRLDARPAPAAAAREPAQLEFHAEAGAPEGALYADGVLVAVLPGVTRL